MTVTQTTCPKCSGRLFPGDRFCAHCGATQEESYAATPAAEEAATAVWGGVLEHLRSATGKKYEIGRALGFGGMAAVFLARELRLNRRVAIKVMSPSLMLAPGMIERFHREAVTVAALNHSNIVTIYTVEETDRLHYFVMKYVPGPSLEAVINKDGPLPISVVKVWLTQIASALGYAHRHGVVHRDIKPANILLDDEGNAIVTDFGIAKVAREPSLTQVGATVGTPPYMSPEQCQSKDVTAASDQYSLGIVLYEMLTGEPPFTGPSLEVMQAHVQARPRPIVVARPDCPPNMQATVFRMLAKDPAERWPAMEDVIAAGGGAPLAHDDPIRLQLAELAGAPKTSTTPIPSKPPASRAPERASPIQMPSSRAPGGPPWARRLLWGAAIVAVGAGAWFVWRTFAPSPPGSVASVTVKPAFASIQVGEQVSLAATVADAKGQGLLDRSVSWTSSDPSVATVSADGAVNGARAGEARVTATTEGKTSSALVNVRAPVVATADSSVASVELNPRRANLRVPGRLTLRAVARDARGGVVRRAVQWSGSDPTVITVSPSGVVVAVGPGTARVIARAEGVQSEPAVVTVTAPPARSTAPGTLQMLIVPTWSYVSVDGLPRGQRTRGVDTLPSGVAHRLHFERDGYISVDTTVTLQPNETRLLTIQMRPRTP